MKIPSMAAARKGSEPGKIRCTIFYPSGGTPRYVDVAPNERDVIEIEGKSFKIMPGSVWNEGHQDRCILNWENGQTINATAIVGDDIFGPEAVHTIDSDNLAVQLNGELSKGSVWSSPMTWGIGIAAIFMVLAMFYIGSAINGVQDGLEALRQAMEGIDVRSGGGANQGHQRIGGN